MLDFHWLVSDWCEDGEDVYDHCWNIHEWPPGQLEATPADFAILTGGELSDRL